MLALVWFCLDWRGLPGTPLREATHPAGSSSHAGCYVCAQAWCWEFGALETVESSKHTKGLPVSGTLGREASS